MTLIQTQTVGAGGSTNLNFTGIPNTFTDLCVVWSTRDNVAGNQNNLLITFNGSSTGYSERMVYGNGSSAAALSQSAANIGFAYSAGSGATANTFSSGQMFIPNYSTSLNKTVSIEVVGETNASSAVQVATTALWSNSAAIDRITLTSNGGTLQQGSTASVYGINKLNTSFTAKATGGTITADADYIYHTFKASGTFTPLQNLTADMLIIAGGGCGIYAIGAGGGAGGVVNLNNQSLSATGYAVTVGAGAGGEGPGSNSSVAGFTTALGGGTNGTGGSGSGAGGQGTGPAASGYAGTAGQGNAGGGTTVSYYSGGGGGAGAPGTGATDAGGGAGGAGTYAYASWALATGTSDRGYYAGGGGGWGYSSSTGGIGGGGAGGQGYAPVYASPGMANTGGGGGGGSNFYYYGGGGSGIVIVRYAR
jgi:hypothetical protein